MPTAEQFRDAAHKARWARDALDEAEGRIRRGRDDHGVIGNNPLAGRLDVAMSGCRSRASGLGDRLDELARQCDWRASECEQYAALLGRAQADRAAWLSQERQTAADEGRLPNEAAAPSIPSPSHGWIQV